MFEMFIIVNRVDIDMENSRKLIAQQCSKVILESKISKVPLIEFQNFRF